jgi:hypothetical protein
LGFSVGYEQRCHRVAGHRPSGGPAPPLHCITGLSALEGRPSVFARCAPQHVRYSSSDRVLSGLTSTPDPFDWLTTAPGSARSSSSSSCYSGLQTQTGRTIGPAGRSAAAARPRHLRLLCPSRMATVQSDVGRLGAHPQSPSLSLSSSSPLTWAAALPLLLLLASELTLAATHLKVGA